MPPIRQGCNKPRQMRAGFGAAIKTGRIIPRLGVIKPYGFLIHAYSTTGSKHKITMPVKRTRNAIHQRGARPHVQNA